MHAFLQESRQAASLRTRYRRTAFQEVSGNEVRVSLDVELCMLREAGVARGASEWCRDLSKCDSAKAPPFVDSGAECSDSRLTLVRACLFRGIAEGDVCEFPYAVAEVKLADEDQCPAWLRELQRSGMLVAAEKCASSGVP